MGHAGQEFALGPVGRFGTVLFYQKLLFDQFSFLNLFLEVFRPVQDADFQAEVEALHLLLGRLQLVHHGVEGSGQPADFVLRLDPGPFGQVPRDICSTVSER